MSKKKFTTGLESLFGDSSEKAFQEESPFLDVEETPTKRVKRPKNPKAVQTGDKVAAKRATKNFTSDLESLFEDAINETIEEQYEEQNKEEVIRKRAKKRRLRPLSGLDALIRHTSDMDYVEVNVPTKKRVTFVFDKQKLERLKGIAKTKKVYLKDIIGDVMSNFIEKCEREGSELA